MADKTEYGGLEGLPLERLEELLAAASTGEEDEAYIDAVVSAILKKEGAALPDIDQAWEEFQQYRAENGDAPLFPADGPSGGNIVHQRPVRSRKLLQLGLAAALAVTFMLGTMAITQAAGADVFGAMARWTDDVFSFGRITDQTDVPYEAPNVNDLDEETEFASLQEALDAYGITEVSEPTWIPDGYTMYEVDTYWRPDGAMWEFTTAYTKETDFLIVTIEYYVDAPSAKIMKSDAPVETFVVNDTTVYLMENSNNNAAAWATEHYGCYILGPVEKSELRQMVLSIYADS